MPERGLGAVVRRLFSNAGAAGETEPPDPRDVNAAFEWCLATTPGPQRRPHYLWSALRAARTARDLGLSRVTVAEFGVAGGNGLVALEAAADAAARVVGIDVDVVGFDTGAGMPPPRDERDIPFLLRPGYFPMDVTALRARLRRATLQLGPVAETVPSWLAGDVAPLGFAAFDLDYYSSTAEALSVFAGSDARVLPRVLCYFDDVLGYAWSDFNGARAAVADFNRDHPARKIGPLHGLRWSLPLSEFHAAWPEKMFMAHLFDHARYSDPEGEVAPIWHEMHRLSPE
jgi:hypothetical protein